MNNTKPLALVAVFIAATLVVGVTFATIAATQPAFAYSSKKKGGDKEGNGNTNTPQEINSESNAVGFDATSENEPQNQICTHPDNDSACSEEGGTPVNTAAAGNNTVPVKLTCEECFKKFLTPDQISQVIGSINPVLGVSSVEDLCAKILSGQLNPDRVRDQAFVALRGDLITVNKLVTCLQEAGIDVHKVISTS